MILGKSGLALLVGAFLVIGVPLTGIEPVAPAAAQSVTVDEAEARGAVQAWLDSVASGDPAKLDAVLAPEFQLLRADGSSHDKASYLVSELPVFETAPQIGDLVVTGGGDVFVARYTVEAKQTRDGVALQLIAPRLSVFRKDGDKWLLVAHANFAALEK